MMIPNLLITDDDSAFRKVVCESLSRRGFLVTEARDGQEALDVLGETEIHVALVDVHMPRIDGLEVMRRLVETPGSPPCVLMSAKLDEQIEQEALQMKVYKVLSKPFGLNELRSVVCGALRDIYGWQTAQ
jgi:two-component system chemotaxis response regulator CheY